MNLKRKFVLLFFTVLFAVMACFTSFAITSSSGYTFDTFDSGPLSGQRALFFGVDSSGAVSRYAVPDWREGSGAGEAYYNMSFSKEYLDGYITSQYNVINNICIVSSDPLVELYAVDYYGVIIADVLEDAFIVDNGSKYFYGISLQNGTGVAFRASSDVLFTEFSPAFNGGSYYDLVANNIPYMSGIYNGSAVAVRYPGMAFNSTIRMATYGYSYLYFPTVAVPGGYADAVSTWFFNSSDAVLHKESTYTMNFKVYNVSNGRIFLDDPSAFNGVTITNGVLTGSISGKDTNLSSLGMGFRRNNTESPAGIVFRYLSSFSDDIGTIPPDDSGGGSGDSPDYSSALASIGSGIRDLQNKLVGGTTTIVNNITNQTTQITNTITNTVTNMTQQITQGLTDVKQGLTDKLTSVQTGINDKLGQVQTGITNKLGQVQDGINNKLEDVQNEIVNGFDNSGIIQENEKLEQSINDYDEVESEIFDEAGGFVGEFEYPSVDSLSGGVIKALAFVGSFLQSIFLCMGDFGSIITFSLTMIFVMVVVGYHRIRS